MAATVTARTSPAPSRRRPATRRVAPPAPRRTSTASSRRTSTGFVPVAAVGGAVGGIADSGLFVWLTRGRLWIGLLGSLLVGIVGLNVMALSFSASSSNAGQAADELRRQNSALRTEVAARLSNSEIQAVAADAGLVMPAAGSIGYLDVSAGDAEKAAQRLRDADFAAAPPAEAVPPAEAAVPVETAAVAEAPVETAETTVPADPATVPADPAVTPPAETTAPVDTAVAGGAVSAP